MSTIAIEHDSPEWHALRARHVGGSEIGALFDLPAGERPGYMLTRYALWHVKRGVPAPPVDGERPKWGIRLEAEIARAAAEEHGWTISKGGYVTDDTTPGLGCTLDYVIASDPDEDGPGALECKNVDWRVYHESWLNDEPPPHIVLQHQHQLACTGYTWGAISALVGGNDYHIYRYRARPKLIAEIRRRVTEFWHSIGVNEEPPIDGSDGASAVVAALYPEISDDLIDLSTNNEWREAAAQFSEVSARRRDINTEYQDAKNRVVALMAGHRRAIGGEWSVTCSITPENPGRAPKPGELIGKRAEVRRYTVKDLR